MCKQAGQPLGWGAVEGRASSKEWGNFQIGWPMTLCSSNFKKILVYSINMYSALFSARYYTRWILDDLLELSLVGREKQAGNYNTA